MTELRAARSDVLQTVGATASVRPRLDADELAAEGERLLELWGRQHNLLFLDPAQEWMAVDLQMPFLRVRRL
jgi:hypothetical protein